MYFTDRADAGNRLAERLSTGPHAAPPVVLALPRGGLPVAEPIRVRLGGALDVVLVRKIGAPGRPEFGVGAIVEDGPPMFDEVTLRRLGRTPRDLAAAVAGERAELDRRRQRYRGDRPPPEVTGRRVILVDDGLATGVTAMAALRWLRARAPRWLVLAVPVCSRPARTATAAVADEVVCLHAPRDFTAVGQWYDDFAQVSDADVEAILARSRITAH